MRLLSFVEALIGNENSYFYNLPLNILSIKLIGVFGQHESFRKGAGRKHPWALVKTKGIIQYLDICSHVERL